jgi:hypothetical protein
VAAFYLDEAGTTSAPGCRWSRSSARHPDTGSNDETVNWSDLLNISAAGSASFDFDH